MKKPISTELTPANIQKVLALLEQTPRSLAALAGMLRPEAARQPLGDGERSFVEGLAHLLNSEARTFDVILQAILLDIPAVPDVHSERDLGRILNLERFPAAELLAYFAMRRKILLHVLRGLSAERWGRTVKQAGKQRSESVYWLARALSLHELEHVEDFRTKLGAEAGSAEAGG